VLPDMASVWSGTPPLRPQHGPEMALDVYGSATDVTAAEVRNIANQLQKCILSITNDAAASWDESLLAVSIDSVLVMSLVRAIAATMGCTLEAQVVLYHPTVDALAAHIHQEVRLMREKQREGEKAARLSEPHAAAYNGLKGAALIYCYFSHFHYGWPPEMAAMFNRQVDMDCLLLVIGCEVYFQWHDSTEWRKWIASYWYTQVRNLVPQYYLAVGCYTLWLRFGVPANVQVSPEPACMIATLTAMQIWTGWGMTTTGLAENYSCIFQSDSRFWFISTTWNLLFVAPFMVMFVRRTCQDCRTARIGVAASIFLYSAFYRLTAEHHSFYSSTPPAKCFIFATGMFLANLMIQAAEEEQEGRSESALSPRGWGIATDLAALALAMLTFGPSLVLEHGTLSLKFFYPTVPPISSVTYSEFLSIIEIWGPEVWDPCPYPTEFDKDVMFPLQFSALALLVYCLRHCRGVTYECLQCIPFQAMGTHLLAFCLFFQLVTRIIISAAGNTWKGLAGSDPSSRASWEVHRAFNEQEWRLGWMPCMLTAFCFSWLVTNYAEPFLAVFVDIIADIVKFIVETACPNYLRECKIFLLGNYEVIPPDQDSDDECSTLLPRGGEQARPANQINEYSSLLSRGSEQSQAGNNSPIVKDNEQAN